MAFQFKQLFYIAHIDNVLSILEHGIFSHRQIMEKGIAYTPIYDSQIVSSRKSRMTPDGKSVWEYANLYFQARNPMLYRVICEKPSERIAVIAVNKNVINLSGVFISKGNAASLSSEIISGKDIYKLLNEPTTALTLEWWKDEDGSKRKIMAECLVPDHIPPENIASIYVSNDGVSSRLARQIAGVPISSQINLIPEPNLSFESSLQSQITPFFP